MPTIADIRGRTFEASGSRRIVSLVPSLTEALFAFGAGDRIVGVTRYCIEPAEARARPQVGGTKTPDIDAIVALRPDLVVASAEENRREDIEALEARGIAAFVTMPSSLAEARDLLTTLALLTATEASARPIVASIDAALERLSVRQPETRLRLFCPIWRRPWMSIGGGTFANNVIELAGGLNVFASREGRYPTVTVDDIVAADPEIVLLPDEPYPFAEKHREELRSLPIAAARTDRIHLCDGKDITWYWSRTAESVGRVHDLLTSPSPA